MKNILLIRIPPPISEVSDEILVQWGAYSGRGDLSGDVHVSKLSQLKEAWLSATGIEISTNDSGVDNYLPDQVVLLLGGTLVLHRKMAINDGQRKHLNTALPFMIEEDLAENVDALHLANQLSKSKENVVVSGIAHNQLQVLLKCLDEQGLGLHHALAEVQFISTEDDRLTIILENNSAIMKFPGQAATNIDYDALHFILGQINAVEGHDFTQTMIELNDAEPAITSVNLYYSEGVFTIADEQVARVRSWLDEHGWLIEEHRMDESVFEYLSDLYFLQRKSAQPLVDLRSGAYQCPRRANRQLRRWRPVALVASLWLMLEMGLMLGEGVTFHQQSSDYWDKSAELYLKIFPQDQQVKDALASEHRSINVKSRMESRLKTTGDKLANKPFLPLLQKISEISASLPELKIQPVSMNFNDTTGNLVLDLRAESLEAVDKLLAATKSSGLVARLDSANQEKNDVNARMTINR